MNLPAPRLPMSHQETDKYDKYDYPIEAELHLNSIVCIMLNNLTLHDRTEEL